MVSKEKRPVVLPWDEHGRYFSSVRLSMIVPADGTTQDDWQEVAREVGMTVSTRGEGWAASASALPAGEITRTARYLYLHAHSVSRDSEQAHWILEYDPVPGHKAPTAVRESSDRVGGYPGVMRSLASRWPGSRVKAEVQLVLFLDATRWRRVFAGRQLPRQRAWVGEGAARTKVTAEAVEWILDPPRAPVERVRYSEVKKLAISLGISGHGEMTFSPQLIEDVELEVWNAIKPLLTSSDS